MSISQRFWLFQSILFTSLLLTEGCSKKKSESFGELEFAKTVTVGELGEVKVILPSELSYLNNSLQIEEGQSLSSDELAKALGLDAPITKAGPSIQISASNQVSPTDIGRLQIEIPFTLGLFLGQTLAVMYVIEGEDGKTLVGYILEGEPQGYKVVNGKLRFLLRGLGTYQAVYIAALVTQERSAQTSPLGSQTMPTHSETEISGNCDGRIADLSCRKSFEFIEAPAVPSNLNGIPSNTITSIRFDSNKRLWLTTLRGLAYSDDRGKSWKVLATQQGLPDNYGSHLGFDDGCVYYGNFYVLYVSCDQMLTWKSLEPEKNANSIGLNDLSIIDGVLFLATNSGLFRSEDKGKNFTKVVLTDPAYPQYPASIIGFSSNDYAYYASSWNSIFESRDKGQSWSVVSKEFSDGMLINAPSLEAYSGFDAVENSLFSAFRVDRPNSAPGYDLYRFDVTSSKWTLSYPDSGEFKSIQKFGNKIALASSKGLLISSNSGQSWELAPQSPAKISSLAYADNSFYAAGFNAKGFWQSADLGQTWSQNLSPLSAQPEYLSFIHAHGSTVTGFSGSNFFKSADQGQTWTSKALDFLENDMAQKYLGQGDILAVSTVGSGDVYLSKDKGESWAKKSPQKPPTGATNIDLKFSDGTLYALFTHGLYASADQGETWNLLGGNAILTNAAGSSDFDLRCLGVFDSELYLLLTKRDPFSNSLLLHSRDKGNTWLRASELPMNDLAYGCQLSIQPGKIFLAEHNPAKIRVSNDAGGTWTQLASESLKATWINQLTTFVDALYVSTDNGLLITRDAGRTWERKGVTNGIRSNLVLSTFVDGNRIYVGTIGGLSVAKTK